MTFHCGRKDTSFSRHPPNIADGTVVVAIYRTENRLIMKRLAWLIVLLSGTFSLSFAQTYDFESFAPLMENRDTAAIRKMLDGWEPKNGDYYAASYNYWILTSEDREDALHTFEVVKEGTELYPDRLDLRFGMIYGLMKVDNYSEMLSGMDGVLARNEENGGQWLWMNDEPVEDSRHSILSSFDDYLSGMRAMGHGEEADRWIDGACETFPRFKSGLLIIRERRLTDEKKTDEAREILQSILDEDPDYRAALMDLGFLCYFYNDFDTAISCFERLLELTDDEEDKRILTDYLTRCREEQARGFFPPDHEELEKFVKKHRKQYDALSARFEAADPTLSYEEIRKVYYGYAFTEDYSPMDRFQDVNDLLQEGDLDAARAEAESQLKKYPVSLWLLRQLFIIAMEQEDDESAAKYQRKCVSLLDGILSTGNGRTMDRAIHVISTTDEYIILSEVFDMESFEGQALVNDGKSSYDRMDFIDTYGEAITLYFNVDLIFRKYNELFDSH